VRKSPKWPWVAGVVVLLLIIIGSTSKSAPKSNTTTPSVATSASQAAAPTNPAPPAKPSGPATSFGDGTWVVGDEIQPGTYRSAGATPGLFDLCSASTHTGDAADGSIIDWKTANAGEPVRIKVSGPAKSVEAHGCETFTKVA
jgi:hypothetical protein